MIENIKNNIVPILFLLGSLCFVVGNGIAIMRGWKF